MSAGRFSVALASIYVIVEGGPGTEHEAKRRKGPRRSTRPRLGALEVTLVSSIRASCRPQFVSEPLWRTLGDPNAAPRTVAEAVLELVTALIKHSVSTPD